MICDKYRGKNTGPQCVKVVHPHCVSDPNIKTNLQYVINGQFIFLPVVCKVEIQTGLA
jgi:hypothetical protein